MRDWAVYYQMDTLHCTVLHNCLNDQLDHLLAFYCHFSCDGLSRNEIQFRYILCVGLWCGAHVSCAYTYFVPIIVCIVIVVPLQRILISFTFREGVGSLFLAITYAEDKQGQCVHVQASLLRCVALSASRVMGIDSVASLCLNCALKSGLFFEVRNSRCASMALWKCEACLTYYAVHYIYRCIFSVNDVFIVTVG